MFILRSVPESVEKAALLNPLPPLGVAPELRPQVLAAPDVPTRLRLVREGRTAIGLPSACQAWRVPWVTCGLLRSPRCAG